MVKNVISILDAAPGSERLVHRKSGIDLTPDEIFQVVEDNFFQTMQAYIDVVKTRDQKKGDAIAKVYNKASFEVGQILDARSIHSEDRKQ